MVFLYAGAIVPEKGVLQLARAFARLRAEDGNAHLALAGTAALWDQGLTERNPGRSYEAEVRALLTPAAREGAVHFLGNMGTAEMPGVYAASDVAVVPSVWQEPFGLVAVEALASSRPVIASGAGGLPEVVDEGCGVLVPPGDERALLEAMRALADDAALRDRLAPPAASRPCGSAGSGRRVPWRPSTRTASKTERAVEPCVGSSAISSPGRGSSLASTYGARASGIAVRIKPVRRHTARSAWAPGG